MKNIIFLAPPAAGKGTFSNLLKDNYNYEHISTGDMLREEISKNTDLGQIVQEIMSAGKYVSDDIVIKLITQKLESIQGKSFILDGFPRTLNQAIVLDEILKNLKLDYQVIYLNVTEEIAKKRIMGRITCECGKSYNLNEEKLQPKISGICDICGKSLVKRNDDNEEAFKVRYESYLEKTEPIKDYYQNKHKLINIDANGYYLNVYQDIIEVITK